MFMKFTIWSVMGGYSGVILCNAYVGDMMVPFFGKLPGLKK